MRLKHIKDADIIIKKSSYLVSNPENYKGKWNEIFNNDNDIFVEIGTGKGKFIISLALENPNINYIGIEKYDTPLVSAVKKLEDINISNLKLICFDASNIENVFDKEISKIYLNFSDPWPKKRHEKRRLTSFNFLSKYDIIFKGEKLIEFKTDNEDLFLYSIVSLTNYGYRIVDISLDLHKKIDFDNIVTEYENKFSNKGFKIKYLKAVKSI